MSLTPQDIENCIASEEYSTVGNKTTVCVLTLKNGFEVVGTASPVDPADYSLEKGKEPARRRAIDRLWELEGYRVTCEKHNAEEQLNIAVNQND